MSINNCMKSENQRYLKILALELEDLEKDLENLEKLTKKRFKSHEITNYVTQENISLLNKEYTGIKDIIRILKSIKVARFENLEDLINHIDSLSLNYIKERDIPEAVYTFIKRKLFKVKEFVSVD